MTRAWMLCGILLAAAVGCADDRPEKLRQEIAELQELRMPTDVFEKMKAEALVSERRLRAFEAEIETEAAQLEGLRAETAGLEAILTMEIARNETLRARITESQAGLRVAAARKIDLETEATRQQARARLVADQASALARELRPEDPEWALSLRLASLREFLEQLERSHRHDADLVVLSGTDLPEDLEDATRVGAAVAARVRDHVEEVYGLDEARASGASEAGAAEAAAPRS